MTISTQFIEQLIYLHRNTLHSFEEHKENKILFKNKIEREFPEVSI